MELCEEIKIFLLYNKSYEELNNSGIFVELELWNSLENYIFKKKIGTRVQELFKEWNVLQSFGGTTVMELFEDIKLFFVALGN